MDFLSRFFDELFKGHALEIWAAGLVWSFIGIIAVKLFFLNPKVKFDITFWLNDNILDVIKGMFWAVVILRLGDYAVHLAKDKFGIEIPETSDFVIVMIVISGIIQWKLHKSRKPISKKVQEEMHVHNENCKHD